MSISGLNSPGKAFYESLLSLLYQEKNLHITFYYTIKLEFLIYKILYFAFDYFT